MSVDIGTVKNRKEAERAVEELLKMFCSDAAYNKVAVEARGIKQRTKEVWKRRVGNLFRSLDVRRSGY